MKKQNVCANRVLKWRMVTQRAPGRVDKDDDDDDDGLNLCLYQAGTESLSMEARTRSW